MISLLRSRSVISPGESESARSCLTAEGVVVDFAGVRALDAVDLELGRHEILGLVGPNGAGKTTLVNVLTGFQRPTAGRVAIDDLDVTSKAAHRLVRRGIARTFQGVRLFGDLTVLENVEAAAAAAGRRQKVYVRELLAVLQLEEKAEDRASSLPYGDERRLGIARALAAQPAFLLLDEPAAGLDEGESAGLLETVRGIRDRFGCGILAIDHDMTFVLRLCERVQVLDYGKTIFQGSPAEMQRDEDVRTAYLGNAVPTG